MGVIILAAGESKRLGQPKQNLLFRGHTLLQNAIDVALDSGDHPVIVVLGANADQMSITPNKNISVLYNADWKDGMASSIRLAVAELIKYNVNAAIMMLCDQPFVSAGLLKAMVEKQKNTGKAIVSCSYAGTVGVPVLFDKTIFPALLQLKGAEGAKKILVTYKTQVATVAFDNGSVDIDTMADYEGLLKM